VKISSLPQSNREEEGEERITRTRGRGGKKKKKE